MDYDLLAASIARDQFGLLTLAQALAAGIPLHHVKLRLRQRRWEAVHRGVYRIAGTPSCREQRVLAACLGSDGVASHRAAAEEWNLDGVDRGWTEVTVSTRHRPSLHGVVVHRTKDLLPRHVTRRNNAPVTNPMRTIVDLGLVVPRHTVQRAMDDALGRKLVTVKGLVQIWRDVARPGRNGSGVLRSLLDEHLPIPSATRLEKGMLRLHRRHGLPEPAVEVDGYDKRTSLQAFRRDRVLDRRLRALGWTVLRFIWFEVMHTPAEVAAEIRPFLSVSAVS